MSSFSIRIFACICMLIDHIGYCGNIFLFRIIGRLAMPLYAFLLSRGYRFTHSKTKYLLRLALLAFLSEIPFDLCFFHTCFDPGHQNVFFTLFLALAGIAIGDALCKRKCSFGIKKYLAAVFFIVPAAFIAEHICADYGWYGIALCWCFYTFLPELPFTERNKFSAFFCFTALWLIRCIFSGFAYWDCIQGFELFSLALIFQFDGSYGLSELSTSRVLKKTVQWGFYLFYPIHLILLSILFH